MSYEELYPKRVVDTDQSRQTFSRLIDNLKVKIELRASMETTADADNALQSRQIAEKVIESLQNNLTGAQIKQFKSLMENKSDEALLKELLEKVKTLDIEVCNQILAEIFACRQIWKEM
jgi:arsenate reductase-like glutaredoxin family protein